jgi:malate dehydrogenase (oxaloacetate-decarboxylating)
MPQMKRSFNEGEEIVEVDMDPTDILHNPILNKGTGFTEEERIDLGIQGLLPYHSSTIEEQVERRYANFCAKSSGIDRHLFLTALQDRNETLFFRLVSEHAEEMLPYIYTPTVGDASLNYSYLYNQNRGIYLSYPFKDQIEEMVEKIPKDRVDVIVVTDGGRILGLGDLGVGGMPIPVGKLALYTLFGGIHPDHTLPVLLDVGTDNPSLLADPLYLGWRHERIKGEEYLNFIDRFLNAIKKRFPNVLIQWEDFSKQNAQPLLERYKDQYCCFNDDIQGTAGVVTAGIFAAIAGTDGELNSQQVVIYGGGSAGIGVAHLITQAMIKQGMDPEEAKSRIFVLGRQGLAHTASEDRKANYSHWNICSAEFFLRRDRNRNEKTHSASDHLSPFKSDIKIRSSSRRSSQLDTRTSTHCYRKPFSSC